MTEVERIIDQLARSLDGPAWHGPSLHEIVADVDPAAAAARPIEGVHTIWEILEHVIAWIRIGRLRIEKAERAGEIDPSEDWPVVAETSAEAWMRTQAALQKEHDLLVARLSRLTDAELSRVVPGKEYSNYFLLHGVVQHNLYHAGQMALLKSTLMHRRSNRR